VIDFGGEGRPKVTMKVFVFSNISFSYHNSLDFSDALIAQGFENFSLITIMEITAVDNTTGVQ